MDVELAEERNHHSIGSSAFSISEVDHCLAWTFVLTSVSIIESARTLSGAACLAVDASVVALLGIDI